MSNGTHLSLSLITEGAEIVKKLRGIQSRCQQESRNPYPDEAQAITQLRTRALRVANELASFDLAQHQHGGASMVLGADGLDITEVTESLASIAGAVTEGASHSEVQRMADSHPTVLRRSGYQPDDFEPDGVDGDDPPALSHNMRVVDYFTRSRGGKAIRRPNGMSDDDVNGFNLGRMIHGMVTGDWADKPIEQRAMSEGTDSAGGYLTPELLSLPTIDRIRNAMRVSEVGALTVPLSSDSQSLPRMTSGVTPAWKAENAAISASAAAFDRITFTPRTLPVLVQLSIELFEDMIPQGYGMIETEIAKAIALEWDRVALRGSGTPPEPKGIRNQTGVTLQDLAVAGASPTYGSLVNAISTLQTANFEPNAIIDNPRTEKTFANLVDTLGQPLRAPDMVNKVPRLTTNQIPVNIASTNAANSDCSEIYTGEWRNLLIGIRTGFKMQVLHERFADAGQIGLVAYMRGDIQLAHATAFVVTTGVRP